MKEMKMLDIFKMKMTTNYRNERDEEFFNFFVLSGFKHRTLYILCTILFSDLRLRG